MSFLALPPLPRDEVEREPYRVKLLLIKSWSTVKGEVLTWPEQEVKCVERAVSRIGGLAEAIKTIRIHRGEVAWLVSCPALGRNPVWLYHEKDKILSKPEKAVGYVIYSDGTIKEAKFKNDKGGCSHE